MFVLLFLFLDQTISKDLGYTILYLHSCSPSFMENRYANFHKFVTNRKRISRLIDRSYA